METLPYVEIRYDAAAGLYPTAAWVANELWEEFNTAVAVGIRPDPAAGLAVYVDGEKLFEQAASEGSPRVSRLIAVADEIRLRLPLAEPRPQAHAVSVNLP
ncbi:MAG: hypothetical protein NTZ05_12165 [Chloroflexi bacterium]|nr:hypothetical protein [Chloroflexota bacterium]